MLAARAIADVLRASGVVALVLVLGLLLGFGFHNGAGGAIGAVVLVLAFGFAFIWIFARLGMLVKDPETAKLAGFIPLFPLLFASSAFVPVDGIGPDPLTLPDPDAVAHLSQHRFTVSGPHIALNGCR